MMLIVSIRTIVILKMIFIFSDGYYENENDMDI